MFPCRCGLGTTLEPALDYERLVRTQPSHRNRSMAMSIRPMPRQAYPWGYQATSAWGRSMITQNGQVIPLDGADLGDWRDSQIAQLVRMGSPKSTAAIGAMAGYVLGHGLSGAVMGAFTGLVASFYIGGLRRQLIDTAAAVTKLQLAAIQKAGT